MTEVLSLPQPDGHSPFGSPLQRSSPQSSFILQHAPTYPRTSPYFHHKHDRIEYGATLPASAPSSAPSSPRFIPPEFSRQPSYISTPASNLSLHNNDCEENDNYFPNYDDGTSSSEGRDPEPPASPESSEPTPPPQSPRYSSALSRSHLFETEQITGDDMAMRSEPSRHVDYLSHAWAEEDIWASWRHVVARKNFYSNGERLANASWRTWAKSKFRLRTVSPETLNWCVSTTSVTTASRTNPNRMKDHDVTWLYGPLQTGSSSLRTHPNPLFSQLSRNNSFGLRKPILKKRSISEIMLQRSLSSSTLMKQATDALRAQQLEKHTGDRSAFSDLKVSDFISGSETPLTRSTTHAGSSEHSLSTSGAQTPSTKRHIHFNNKVEQCIAINCGNEDHMYHVHTFEDDSESSEDDVLTMKTVKSSDKGREGGTGTPRNSFSSENKTIAMLPSTTLKYRGDTPDPEAQNAKDKQRLWNPLNSQASQQTLRPSTPSANFLLDEEDDDADMSWQPSAGRRGSVFPQGGIPLNLDDEEEEGAPDNSDLRRTSSGMFMPYDEREDYPREGILGRVVDTVNTAKDIAHVIWNVGWHSG